MSRFSFISSQHITLAQAFFESFKHSLANLLGAGWLSGTWGPDLGLCWVGQPLSEWSAHHCFWFSCSLAMRAPSGSSLLLLLGCACSCHRDVWPRVFRTMGAAPWSPGSLSASVFWEVWMQLLTLITKYSEQNKMFLLCSAGHQPLFVSASIFFFLLFPFRRGLFFVCYFLQVQQLETYWVFQLVLCPFIVSVSQRFPSHCPSKGIIIVGFSLCIIVGSLSFYDIDIDATVAVVWDYINKFELNVIWVPHGHSVNPMGAWVLAEL